MQTLKYILIGIFIIYAIALFILAFRRTKRFMAGGTAATQIDDEKQRSYNNYHTHSTFCDGGSSAEEIVLAAIENGMGEIGFSSHSHLDSEPSWTLSTESEKEYKKTILELKSRYKDQIKVRLGIEQDYWSKTDNLTDYEYVIGAVHSIWEEDTEWSSVDMDYANFDYAVDHYFGGDRMAAVERYFELVGDLYKRTKCDIIAHFDLITKLNEKHLKETGELFVDDEDPRYINAERRALEKLVATPVIFEINTGAMSRGYATVPYPSQRVLQYLSEHKTPVILASDSHSKETLTYAFDDVMNLVIKYNLNLVEKLP